MDEMHLWDRYADARWRFQQARMEGRFQLSGDIRREIAWIDGLLRKWGHL